MANSAKREFFNLNPQLVRSSMWHGIYGHDDVVERFRQSMSAERLASSYLFLGPAGVGKFTFATKLAQALLCQADSAMRLDPCGECESCRLFEAGNHADFDYISLPEGKRWLPVELFVGDRDHRHQEGLCHNIALRPRHGKRRVAIVDDADHLTLESANSLLKTLEEPPLGAVLILVGTSRSRQLPTILSRTQIVQFTPLSSENIEKLLLEQEIVTDKSHAGILANSSEGTLQRAKELADPELWQLRQSLLPQLAPQSFDSIRLAAELGSAVNNAGKEANARRGRLRAIFQMVGDHFRQVLHASCGAEISDKGPQLQDSQAVVDQDFSTQQVALAVLDRCLAAEEQLDRNANQATLLECWLDDLARVLIQPAASSRN